MKICLVFPRTTIFENPMVYPPLGLFYIMAVLKKAGHEVHFADMSQAKTGPPDGFDVYMISGTSPQSQEIIRLAKLLKESGKTVVAGGPHVTNNAGPAMGISDMSHRQYWSRTDQLPYSQRNLVENIHVLVKYEGEMSIPEILLRLDEARLSMYKHGRGIVIERPLMTSAELSAIPIPDRSFARLYEFNLIDRSGNKHRTTTMMTTRGCPERCAFCDSSALWSRRVRYIPMIRVCEELDDIVNLGFTGVYFYDDTLFINRDRSKALYDELGRRGLVSRGNLRTDIICHPRYGKEFLTYLADRGLVDAFVGVESGSNQIKANVYKGTTIEQDTVVLAWCKELGIKFKASVILGLPGETRESMEATRRWVLENRPDKVNICLFVPFPGIPIVKGVNKALGRADNDSRSQLYGSDTQHDYDVRWDMELSDLENYFFAGSRQPGSMQALVRTSALSNKEIQHFFDSFVADVEKAGIPY